MTARTAWFLLATVTVICVSHVLTAGPLNPPTGPVTSGGKTTQELFDAITQLSTTAGGNGRSAAAPGGNYSAGTYSLATTPAMSGPLLGLRQSISTSYGVSGGSYILASTAFGTFTIVRELGTSSASTYKISVMSQAFPSATVTVPSSGGNTVYALTFCYIVGERQYSIPRGDGTFAAVEELDLLANQVKVTDPSGAMWNYNYLTHVGS